MIVRFIANMLDHMQGRRIRRQAKPPLPAQRITFPDPLFDRYLSPRPAAADDVYPGDVQFSKHGFRLGQLSLAAVYQDHIRDLVVINRFTIATAQDLIHRRIVIAGVMPVML